MVRKFSIADAFFGRSPGQDGDLYTGSLVDKRHGGPITIGYGRYAPNKERNETLGVDDVMVVLEGRLSVSSGKSTVTAGPGEIVYMSKSADVTIRSHGRAVVTAYVSFPDWHNARD